MIINNCKLILYTLLICLHVVLRSVIGPWWHHLMFLNISFLIGSNKVYKIQIFRHSPTFRWERRPLKRVFSFRDSLPVTSGGEYCGDGCGEQVYIFVYVFKQMWINSEWIKFQKLAIKQAVEVYKVRWNRCTWRSELFQCGK